MYDKFRLLGLNQSGRTPVSRKPRAVHDVKQPIAHTHALSREYEKAVGSSPLMRGAPKKTHTVEVNSGMHFRDRDGKLNAGITHQQVVTAPDASGRNPLDPTVPGKRLTPVTPVPGQRRRSLVDGDRHGAPGAHHEAGKILTSVFPDFHGNNAEAGRVLDDGIAVDHSHPVNIAKRIMQRRKK